MKNGVAIQYGDVAPEAKENFVPSASEDKFGTVLQLQEYNLNLPNYGNPCEMYSVLLDGETRLLPRNYEGLNVGLISENISEQDGTFTTPIVLTLESVGQYTSQGLTLTFDTYNDIFATNINIKWYRKVEGNQTLLDNVDFAPDSAFYFCQNQIENYNKLVITFYAMNMPENRLKLRGIDYGYGTFFYGDELRNVKLIQEIDPISSQISINTADFTLDSKGDIEYNFQQKQPLNVYFNGVLRATTFVKSSKRKARFLWDVQSEDYIGTMEATPFVGGIYENKNATELLSEIFELAKVPYNISTIFDSLTVTGYIPYTNCRNALMQVAFAVMAIVDTSNSSVVNVFRLNTTPTQTIPLNRIMQGQRFDSGDRVTAVEVISHTYTPTSEIVEVYKAEDSGTGQNLFVKFSEPLHDLEIVHGTIVSRGTNYATINADANCILGGYKYEHTTTTHRRNNPVVLATDLENVVAIEQATLVSNNNVDNVLNNCYNWIVKTNTTNLKIVEGKTVIEHGRIKYGQRKYGTFKYGEEIPPTITYDEAVNVGDAIQAETEYLGIVGGTVIKQTYNLNGNIIIKDTVMK